ncbi:hypothetical protein F5B22DRAFT_466452 [Xylaria bambusicola]|uniref:uncharacterized protein n=1 Tax=Xylaria bambusicola TaxID=326684 RepID=UPI002007681E|nr:uncharacterized protein F5B22DRAFT_466452 [Xylaria bambusicola]KAI0522240.1 hypothetical protein F5B22DRAFT_466452 [Xylaria bambusicola]
MEMEPRHVPRQHIDWMNYNVVTECSFALPWLYTASTTQRPHRDHTQRVMEVYTWQTWLRHKGVHAFPSRFALPLVYYLPYIICDGLAVTRGTATFIIHDNLPKKKYTSLCTYLPPLHYLRDVTCKTSISILRRAGRWYNTSHLTLFFASSSLLFSFLRLPCAWLPVEISKLFGTTMPGFVMYFVMCLSVIHITYLMDR